MYLNKKRNKILKLVILMSILVFGFAIYINHFDTDEYIVSWLFAMSQALFIFAIFRFKTIKKMQKKCNVVKRITIAILWIGVIITLIGTLLSEYFIYKHGEVISHIGSFIAGLGINGLISYMSNYFDFLEVAEDNEQQKNENHEISERRKVNL